ncbi:MAG: hypothetical protein JWM07_134 [Candidatus Saccharibacteria bacterium]|nr:hypothetical protein [Candidatus Saccharibacteria bacterium]
MTTLIREDIFISKRITRMVRISTRDKDYGTVALEHPVVSGQFWQRVVRAFSRQDSRNSITITTTVKDGSLQELPFMRDYTTNNFYADYRPTDRLEAIRLHAISYIQLDPSLPPSTLMLNCMIELSLHFDNNGSDAVTELSTPAMVRLYLKTGQLQITT